MQNPVYSQSVIEFAAVATESVSFFEKANSFEKKDYLLRLSKLLPIIYLKASTLPDFEMMFEEDLEHFVTEEDYEFVRQSILTLLGNTDSYSDFFKTDNQWSDMPELENATISEDIADIYQDLKDFSMRYQIGNEDIMNDALYTCQQSFREYWGMKLVSALKAIHNAIYNNDSDYEEEDECECGCHGEHHHHHDDECCCGHHHHEDSFLHKRMNDYQDENNDEWN